MASDKKTTGAAGPPSSEIVPSTPLSGEEDIETARGLGGSTGLTDVQAVPAPDGTPEGIGTVDMDEGIPGPGKLPGLSSGGPEIGSGGVTQEVEDDIKSATDRDGTTGFARAGDDEATAGLAGIDDRGTVTGVSTAKEGGRGPGSVGMDDTNPTSARTTEPLSKQGSVTGAEETTSEGEAR